jgi:class 3 adenylate cyclase/tetratricopeptide (TPR) repeat protein
LSNPFIPETDVELIRNGQVVFQGALLLADISGFTSMTEMLAESGKAGTEQLTALLNNYFDKMLTIAEEYGGSVITFSGDSLLVRFADKDNAAACARKMLNSMGSFSNMVIAGNRFSLKAKVVVGEGRWNQYIIGDSKRAHLLLRGRLIKELAQREKDASAGDLILFHSSARVSSAPQAAFPSVNEAFLSPGSDRLHGEHRTVTAVFLNLLTDNAGHRVLKNFQSLYREISSTVGRFGGYLHHIDDLLSKGSRILILFGAPVSHGNDTLNAVMAMMELFSDTRKKYGFRLSCGIDTGYAFSGMVGNDNRKQYTVIGDPVNTAARLAENTASGTVNVSESVYNRTVSNLEYRELCGITVKGKNKPLKRFTPLCRLTSSHDSIPFAGREKELRELTDLINSGKGTILLTGSAGIGKTALLNRLQNNLSAGGFTVQRAEKNKHGPVNEILITLVSGICGIRPDMDKTAAAGKLHNHLAATGNQQLIMREVFLAKMLLGLTFFNRTFETLPPRLKLENLLDSIALLIRELSDPLCVVIEDVHYSDEEEMASLHEVIQSVLRHSNKKICFILSSRPDDSTVFKDQPGVFCYQLKGMKRLQSCKLLAGIADGIPMASEVMKTIADRSQGNPFFLVQFFLYLREKKLILLSDNCWKIADETSLGSLPESIFSMIMARIDALGEQTRESLKVASVFGVKFEESILGSIVQRNVHGDLIETSLAGLTYSIKYSELEYIFSHMLIRDVAYDSLLRERRKQIHGEIGRILEEKNSIGGEVPVRILAYHFENAEQWESALKYSIEAGKLATDLYRNQEALNHYNSGIRIVEEHLSGHEQDLAECVYQSGSLLQRTGEYSEALNSFKRSSELFEDVSRAGNSMMSLADVLFTQGKTEEGLTIVNKLSSSLTETDGHCRSLELEIAAYIAWTFCISGNIDAAMEKALEAVKIGESLSGLSEHEKASKLGHALNTLATVHWANSEYSKAKDLYERAIEIALANGMKREAAITWGNIGLVLEKLGRLHEAVDGMNKQLAMSAEVGDKLIILSANGELGMTYAALGDFDLALYHGIRQKELAESLNVMHDTILAYNHLASVYNSLGQINTAEEYIEKALMLSRKFSVEREEAQSLYILAVMKNESGDNESALLTLEQALKLSTHVHSYSLQQMICLLKADILTRQNEPDQAFEVLAKAWELAGMTEMQAGYAAHACTLAKLHAALGKTDEAVKSFKEGIEMYRVLDAKPPLADAYRAFALMLWKIDEKREARQYMQKAEELYTGMKLPDKAMSCKL